MSSIKSVRLKNTRLFSKRFKLSATVLLLVLISTSVYNILFTRTMEAEWAENRQRETQNIAAAINERLGVIESTVRGLMFSPHVDNLVYGVSPTDLTMTNYKTLIETLALLHINQNMSVYYYVHFYKMDVVVSKDGIISPKGLEDLLKLDLGLEDMRAASTRKVHIHPNISVYSLESAYVDRQIVDSGTIYFYPSLNATVLAVAKNEPIQNLVRMLLKEEGSTYWVLDDAGQVLVSSDGAGDVPTLEKNSESGPYVSRRSGRYTSIVNTPSSMSGLAKQRANAFIWVTVTLGMLFILLLISALSREIFNPMKSILESIDATKVAPRDEYAMIDGAIRSMQGRIADLTQENEQRLIDHQTSSFNQILLGVDLEGSLSENTNDPYVVVSAYFEDEAYAQTISSLLSRFSARLVVSFPGQRTYIVPITEDDASLMAALTQEPLQCAVGISKPCSTLEDIRGAYEEANSVLDAPMDFETSAFPLYLEGKSFVDQSIGVQLNFKDAGMLMSAVNAESPAKALVQITEIYAHYARMTVKQCRHLSAYLINLLRMIDVKHKLPEGFYHAQIEALAHLILPEHMCALVKDAFSKAAEKTVMTEDDEIVRFVKDYVEAHYAENIYLKTISEKANRSYAYVSHCFSTQTSMNFVDYLNGYRVEKAKLLLLQTAASISVVASLVGFGSVNTFIRNMKKHEGVTPDAYRRMFGKAPESDA